MESENLKQRLMRLHLEAYGMVLEKMNLTEVYYFRLYAQSDEMRLGIEVYVDDLISRNDQQMLNSSDAELRMYLAVLANEDINGCLNEILYAGVSSSESEPDEYPQDTEIYYH